MNSIDSIMLNISIIKADKIEHEKRLNNWMRVYTKIMVSVITFSDTY